MITSPVLSGMIAGMAGVDPNGVAALITAVGGVISGIVLATSGLIGKRNTARREDLKACEQDRDTLEHQVLLLELWSFQLCRQLTQNGYEPVPRPVLEPNPSGGA